MPNKTAKKPTGKVNRKIRRASGRHFVDTKKYEAPCAANGYGAKHQAPS